MSQSIAIVGAGISGAVCAKHLAGMGNVVTVFDKGRGPGGRVSSRRTETGHRFDHGAAKIDVTDPAMHTSLAPAVAAGVVVRSGDLYTSPTGLSAVCKWLLGAQAARYATKIIRVERGASWAIFDDAGNAYGPFDQVVLAVPPVNAAEAVAGHDARLSRAILAVKMLPRWVAMLAFAQRLGQVPDWSFVGGQCLRRSLSNTVGDAMVIQASAEWSVANVQQEAEGVGRTLLELVRPALGTATPTSIAAHRWRYAFVGQPLGQPFLDGGSGLSVCGDWCLGRSIESAWQSGAAVAAAIDGN